MPVIRGALQVLIGRALSVGVAALVFGMLAPASACGRTSDCLVGDRTYRISKPEGVVAGERIGALVFMHGWRSHPANVMANTELAKVALDLGLALIAPKSSQDGWDIPGSPSERARVEVPFFDRLLAVVAQRHGIDPKNMIASGFSAGGMMAWNLICYRGDRFRAFIPIAGTYWRPIPESCPTPKANVVHIHGTADPTVPLTGRVIRQWQQGDVARALKLYRAGSDYGAPRHLPSQSSGVARLRDVTCQQWLGGTGNTVAFCTHDGGHWFKASYISDALDLLGAKVVE